MNNKRTKRTCVISKALSLILALAMILTMMPAMVFAETPGAEPGDQGDGVINLVMFGNSTTNGFGLPDAYRANNGFSLFNNYLEEWAIDEKAESRGFIPENWNSTETTWTKSSAKLYNEGPVELKRPENKEARNQWKKDHPQQGKMSVYAFPWMMKEYLSGENHEQPVDMTAFSLDGMRSDELRAFLDKDYYEEVVQREADYTARYFEEHPGASKWQEGNGFGFLNSHVNDYIGNLKNAGAIENKDYDEAHDYITEKVSNADVIIVDVCGNNFGTYLVYRLMGYSQAYPVYYANTYETINDVNSKLLPAEVKEQINYVRTYLKSKIEVMNNPFVEQVLDSFVYGFADCIANFNAYMEKIQELNPDATVISVGLNNPMQGLKFSMNGTTIDVGEIMGIMLNCMNAYMKAIDKNADHYYYAELPDNLESFESIIAEKETIEGLLADDEDGCGNYAINLMYNELVKEFLAEKDENNTKYEDGDDRAVYTIIQNAIKAAEPQATFPAWDDLADDATITVTAGDDSYTVVYNAGNAYVADGESGKLANSVRLVENPEDAAEGEVVLTKAVITDEIVEKNIKPIVMEMLHSALRDHQNIDISVLQSAFVNLWYGSMGIYNYLTEVFSGNTKAELTDFDWVMVVIYEKFFLGTCVGVHPDRRGCETKSNAIIAAYANGQTAREQTISEVRAQMAAASRMLKEATTPENIQKTIAKLIEIQRTMEENGSAEQFRTQMENLMKQAMPLIAEYLNDMIKQAGEAAKEQNIKNLQKLAENLKALEASLKEMQQVVGPELAKQFTQINEQLKTVRELLEKAAQAQTQAIMKQLQNLANLLNDAETQEEYRELFEALQKLGTALFDIEKVVPGGKNYYNKTVDEFMEVQRNTVVELDGRISSAMKKSAMLTARSIDANFSAVASIKDGKAKVNLSLDTDELAAGYVLKLNGKEVKFTEKNGKLTYTVNNAKIGSKYNFELTPYVFYEDGGKTEKISGKTVKKTVVPKVSLAKAKVKKAKAGSGSVTVKWAKVKGADGYKISIKGSGNKKTVTVKGGATTSAEVTELASGKCNVKVRAYKTVNGKKYYGKWSKAKKATVK